MIQLPRQFDIDHMGDFISQLIDTSRQFYSLRNRIDFSSLEFIKPSGVTSLANILELAKARNTDMLFENYSDEEEPIRFLDDCGFFKAYLGESLRRPAAKLRDSTFPIQPIRHRDSFAQIELEFLPWLNGKLQMGTSSLARLATCLKETFNNIKDHSTEDIGCMFAQFFPRSRELMIAISDFGIGIPAEVGRVLPKLTDEEAIERATKRGFSSKFGRNRGVGLDEIIDYSVNALGGTVRLFSGKGQVLCDGGRKHCAKIKWLLSWDISRISVADR